MNIFKHRHFKYDIIIRAVRWYCKYGISYRDLEEMLMEMRWRSRSLHNLPLGSILCTKAVDKHDNTIDFYLSRTRNANAAKLFLGKALKSIPE